MTTFLRYLKPIAALALVAVFGIAAYTTRDRWLPWLQEDTAAAAEDAPAIGAEHLKP